MKVKTIAISLIAGMFLVSSVYAKQASSQSSTGSSQQGSSSGDQGAGGMKGSGAMNSSEIKEVQQKLNGQGYDAGPVDGKMGPKTKEALRKFQQKEGIQPTGQLDQKTLAALGVQGQGSGKGGATSGGSSSGGTQGSSSSSPGMGGGKQNGGSSGSSGGSGGAQSQQGSSSPKNGGMQGQ